MNPTMMIIFHCTSGNDVFPSTDTEKQAGKQLESLNKLQRL